MCDPENAASNNEKVLSEINQTHAELIEKVITRRSEVLSFEAFLRDRTAWRSAPASTRFHLSHEGGLIEHSLNVAQTLLSLRRTLCPDITEESCVIVGLYHDIGKIGEIDKPFYLPNPSEWHKKNRGIHYVINPEITFMDIATRSLFIVSQHIPLSVEEAQAIRFHDGQYIPENQGVAHRESPLTRLIQYADNWSGGVLEENPKGL